MDGGRERREGEREGEEGGTEWERGRKIPLLVSFSMGHDQSNSQYDADPGYI